jgi:Tol biopolymer transport system component
MIDDQQLEREVASVFAGMAPLRGPDALLDDVFLTTGRMRPRPRWLALIKEPPMRTSTRVSVGSPTFRLITIAIGTIVLLLAGLAAVGIGARVLSADGLKPYGPARTGPLLYSAGADIYLADPDGSDPRPIITGNAFDQVPWFSPDGTKIAFGRGSEITRALMVADADGSNVTRLLGPGFWMAEFLPGSDQMVVLKPVDADGQLEMSIIDVADGATVRTFDVGPEIVDWGFMPRPPDGREIIFVGRQEDGSDELALYGIGVDGTGLRSIGAPAPGHDEEWSFLDPSISPDGSTILYWNNKPTGAASPVADQQLHMRDLETGEELPVPFDRDGFHPQFSPDGSMVLYVGWWDDGSGDQLFIVPVDGSQPRRPIGPKFMDENGQDFGFSPDGTMVFLDRTGETTLIDVASGATTELTGGGGPEASGWQRLAP